MKGTFVHLKFKNWDKYNKRQKDIKRPYWFAMSNEIFTDAFYVDLSDQERQAFLWLLCEASKQNKYGELEVSEKLFCLITGYKAQVLFGVVDKLLKSGRAAGSRQDGGRIATATEHNITLHDTTEQDSTVSPEQSKKPKKGGNDSGKPDRGPENSRAAWEAYGEAFKQRWKTDPLRNARVNSQMAQFLKRVPADEAPEIIRFYVFHNKAFYVEKQHPIGLLLQDAESIRTQWATQRQVTRRDAQSAENKQSVYNAFAGLLKEEGNGK